MGLILLGKENVYRDEQGQTAWMLPTVVPLRSPVPLENAEVTQAHILHGLEEYAARTRRRSTRSVRRRRAQQTLGDHKRARCRGNVVGVERKIVAPQATELALLEPEHPEVATIEELYIADEQARWDPRDYWRMPLSYPRAS